MIRRLHEHADEALADWAERNPDSARQMLTDPGLHQQQQILRSVLVKADRAMEAEGIVSRARRRIINHIVFGAADPNEVLTADQVRRMSEQQMSEINLDPPEQP
jgi:hypothetical protein